MIFKPTKAFLTGGTFINRGTLRKSGGTGTSSMSPSVFQNEGGTIDVQHGILALNPLNGGSHRRHLHRGHGRRAGPELARGADLHRHLHRIGRRGRAAEASRLFRSGLGLNVAGATFNFPAGLFQWLGGTLDGGAAGFNNTGFITLAGADFKGLGGVLNNAGTIVHAGTGNLTLVTANGVLNNLPGGLYDLQGDVNFSGNAFISTFNNAGTLRKSAGAGISTNIGVDFQNIGGTIDVRTGEFQLKASVNPAAASTGGTFLVAKDALLGLNGANAFEHMVLRGTYSGSGEGFVQFDTGVMQVGAGGATFNFPPGMFQWTGGTIDARTAPLTNRGSITLPDFALQPHLAGALNNAGQIIMQGTATLTVGRVGGGKGIITNLADGLFEFQGDEGVVASQAINRGDDESLFINQGLLRKASGPGTATINVPVFSNTGTLAALAGTVRFERPTNIDGPTILEALGDTLTAGTWQVAAGSRIDLATAGTLTKNNAHVILDGAGSSIPQLDTLASNSGSFSLLNGRNLTTAGPLTNSGSLTLGAGSTLSVTGTYTQTAGATLSVQLGGDPASGKFGQLVSSEAATLDGTFDVALNRRLWSRHRSKL